MSTSSRGKIRDAYKTLRKRLPIPYQKQTSAAICNRIAAMPQFQNAHKIGLYYAVNGEVDLNELWKMALQLGKLCYFPALNEDKTLAFLPATLETPHHVNRFGILEPQERHLALALAEMDILFVPLVAFDDRGARLGMGAGYYDRTLALSIPKLLAGVGYDLQRVHRIEEQPWDVPLSVVITEQATYWSKKSCGTG